MAAGRAPRRAVAAGGRRARAPLGSGEARRRRRPAPGGPGAARRGRRRLPPRLEEDADRVAYELADWPADQLRELEAALDHEGILAEWTEEGELLVYETDEERVDALFEQLDLHGPDERISLEGEELTSLLNDVLLAADRLVRDARDPDAVVGAVAAAREVAGVAPPLGFDERAWEQLSAQLAALRDVLEREDADAGDEEVSSRAREIRDRLRQWL